MSFSCCAQRLRERGGGQDAQARGQHAARGRRADDQHVPGTARPTADGPHHADAEPVGPPVAGDPPAVGRRRSGPGAHGDQPEAAYLPQLGIRCGPRYDRARAVRTLAHQTIWETAHHVAVRYRPQLQRNPCSPPR